MLGGGEIVLTRVVCRAGDQVAVNARWWLADNPTGTGSDETAFGTALAAVLPTAYKVMMSNSASYQGLTVQKMWPTPPNVQVVNTVGFGPGQIAFEVLPRQVTGLISFSTPYAGRKYRGRLYIPFPSRNENTTAGAPSGPYLAAAGPLAQAYVASYTIGVAPNQVVMKPIIPGRVLVPGSDPPRYILSGGATIITGYTVRGGWATQRRRGSFGRPNIVPF